MSRRYYYRKAGIFAMRHSICSRRVAISATTSRHGSFVVSVIPYAEQLRRAMGHRDHGKCVGTPDARNAFESVGNRPQPRATPPRPPFSDGYINAINRRGRTACPTAGVSISSGKPEINRHGKIALEGSPFVSLTLRRLNPCRFCFHLVRRVRV